MPINAVTVYKPSICCSVSLSMVVLVLVAVLLQLLLLPSVSTC